MTEWHDELSRQTRTRSGRGASTFAPEEYPEPQSAPPGSRRAAREAERRAADALAAGQLHPSGVVDFGSHDFGPDVHDDQAFRVNDTDQIWDGVGRGGAQPGYQVPPAPAYERPAYQQPAAPQQPAAYEPNPAYRGADDSLNGGLMDRVRGAMLHRDPVDEEPTVATRVVRQVPAAPAPSRREMRQQAAAAPDPTQQAASWFSSPVADAPQPTRQPLAYEPPAYEAPTAYQAPARPQAAPSAFQGRPEAYQEPRAYQQPAGYPSPQPFHPADLADIEIELPPVRGGFIDHGPDRQSPRTAPVNLPGFLAEPDDEPYYDDEPQGGYQPTAFHQPSAPTPAPRQHVDPPTIEPAGINDLAGFEALIRRAQNAQGPMQSEAPAQQPGSFFDEPQPRTPEPLRQLRPAQQARPAQPTMPWFEDEHDEDAGFNGLLSRNVASPHGASNALIMDDPQPDLTNAVSGTGDIFVTGSHHLPRSLATTGTTADRYDSVEIDRLFEAAQDEPAAGVSPVRAARAINSSARTKSAVVAPRGHRASVLPTVLAVVAGVMALGVVALLVGSWVLRLF